MMLIGVNVSIGEPSPPIRKSAAHSTQTEPENADLEDGDAREEREVRLPRRTAHRYEWALLATNETSPARESICATALWGVEAHDERTAKAT